MPYRGFALCLFALALCGCASHADLPSEPGVTWRGREAYDVGQTYILATSSGAAEEVGSRIDDVVAAIREASGLQPAKGIVIAMDADDPLLIDDPQELIETLERWHRTALGEPKAHVFSPRLESGVDPVVVSRAITVAVPHDSDPLELPTVLVERTRWTAIVATRSALEDSIDEITEVGLQKLSFGERLLARPMLLLVSGDVVERMDLEMRPTLFRACLVGVDADAATKQRIFKALITRNESEKRRQMEELHQEAIRKGLVPP